MPSNLNTETPFHSQYPVRQNVDFTPSSIKRLATSSRQWLKSYKAVIRLNDTDMLQVERKIAVAALSNLHRKIGLKLSRGSTVNTKLSKRDMASGIFSILQVKAPKSCVLTLCWWSPLSLVILNSYYKHRKPSYWRGKVVESYLEEICFPVLCLECGCSNLHS